MNAIPEDVPPTTGPDVDVEWARPEEAALFWVADLMHWPNGISPLAATMDLPPWTRGFKKAADTLSMPLSTDAFDFKVIRGYVYNSFTPYSTDRAQMEARLTETQARMRQHMSGLLNRWYNEYEPEVRALNEEVIAADYGSLTDEALAEALERLVDERERQAELHYLTVFPAGAAVMAFEEVYRQLFGEPQAGEHLSLLQGFPNKSLETDAGLWRLAAQARRDPRVHALLRTAEPGKLHAAMAMDPETSWFRAKVDEFLDIYGWRANEHDIAAVTWREDPSIAYKIIREYAERSEHDPDADQQTLVAARKARERSLMSRLAGSDQADLFRTMLVNAQQYLPIEEDHCFWIDQQGVAAHRIVVLEAARRLVRGGSLAAEDDVFYLEFDELLTALRGPLSDLREQVARRRWAREQNRLQAPPPMLGTRPPIDAPSDPFLTRFFGAPPEPAPDPRILRGNGASAGTVTGTARVLMSLDQADNLTHGDILVCPATMASWTPLFASAAAVVTDHGGVLSHTAIVAREYGIPAVVGTKAATAIVRDGQTITVDGTAGTVKLEQA
jgi:phosphohistidine swiveling domain-containing protein